VRPVILQVVRIGGHRHDILNCGKLNAGTRGGLVERTTKRRGAIVRVAVDVVIPAWEENNDAIVAQCLQVASRGRRDIVRYGNNVYSIIVFLVENIVEPLCVSASQDKHDLDVGRENSARPVRH
jgi:hypothetical protein